MNQPAPIEFVYLFEYGSYLSWLFLLGFFFFYKKERIVQWFIIAMTLSFPMEWLADNYWMFLNYDSQFTPMIGHFPLFMPFSWGWFFGLVIAVSLAQKTRLDQYSRLVQGLIIFAAFFAWDTLVESLATSVNLWVYWWGAESFIPGTRLPIWIPLFTALQTPAFYFTAVWAKERYANAGWWQGFTPVFGVLVLSQAIEAILGWLWITKVIGHDPTPYAPQWWVGGGWLVF